MVAQRTAQDAASITHEYSSHHSTNVTIDPDGKTLLPSSPPLRPYSSVPGRMPHDADLPCSQRMESTVDGHAQPRQPAHVRFATLYNMLPSATASKPFAGRLGGIQSYVVDRSDPENADLLKKVPDAAPNLSFSEAFDLRGFKEFDLYKAAIIEGLGSFVLVFASSWVGVSPNVPPPIPTGTAAIFGTASFLGPLIAALLSAITIPLLIYSFGAISGAHMNPLITLGTFFARLTTFPRMVLYISGQLAGASLAGLMLRAAAETRDFKVGGCFLFTDMASVESALTIEFMGDLLMLILAFGVGLDPRQAELFGPALGPVLVGLAVGSTTLTLAFSKPGYGGASLNPARCFGIFVGSRFPSWSWVVWVGPIAASMFHGIGYCLIPPVAPKGKVFKQNNEYENSQAGYRNAGAGV